METIDIISNFDENILISNMLIGNQKKLLNMVIDIFESDDIFSQSQIDDIDYIQQYLNKQKFINWELFLQLVELKSNLYLSRNYYKTNSLEYIVENRSTKLINFLLNLTLKKYREFEKITIDWDSVFVDIIRKIFYDESIMNKLIDLILIDDRYQKLLNKKIHGNKTTIFYIMLKCSETIILRLITNGLIPYDWKDDYSNNLVHWSCKRNMEKLFILVEDNNLDCVNNGGKTPLDLACIKNNYKIVKKLISHNVNLKTIDLEFNTPLDYAIKYGSNKLVQLLLDTMLDLDIMLDINFITQEKQADLFYKVIKNRDYVMIDYFINSNIIDIENTNWLWTTILMGNKNMYSQMFLYGKKRLIGSFYKFIDEINKCFEEDGLPSYRML